MPKQAGLRRQGEPPLPFVQMRQQHPETEGKLRTHPLRNGHTTQQDQTPETDK
jgi:hypothetical protein